MNRLDLLYGLLVAASAPWWMRKARSGWRDRFGHIEPLRRGPRPRVMIHAVSVGEVNALRTLVPLLARDVNVLVTAGTDTGVARAQALFTGACDVRRYPLDFSACVRRFLDHASPDVVALVELEIWPNFVRECRTRRIPVCVINGRLSERSFRGYRRIRRWIGRSFRSLEFAAVQDEAYASRFEAMGVSPESCLISGSMKWDAAVIEDSAAGAEELARAMGIDRSRPLIVAGSTGPGEEELIVRSVPPGVQVLCAPRRPERFDEAAAAMPGCVRRSAAGSGSTGSGRFLLDSIGELRAAYALADVAIVGRSFGDQFGSDPVEPAALGKPVVIGPAVADFASMVEAFDESGGIVRTTREGLTGALRDLIENPARRASIAARARACIRVHQGASRRHADLLSTLVRRGNPTAGARERGSMALQSATERA